MSKSLERGFMGGYIRGWGGFCGGSGLGWGRFLQIGRFFARANAK